MLSALLEIVGEFLLQLVVEVLLELGFQALTEPFQARPNPWFAGLGFALFGVILGALSLAVAPAYLVQVHGWRIANLIVAPLALGFGMAMLGRWRARRGDPVLRIDRFAYGYLFALAFAAVRFVFAA